MHGSSLLQLLVTLALAALLATLGIGAWRPVVDSVRLRVAEAAVVRTLAQARLAALSSGRTVQVCPSVDGLRCAAGPAAALAVVGADGQALPGAGAGGLPPGVLLSANRPAVSWYPWPRAASPVTLVLCPVAGGAASRHVIVSQGGRVRTERAAAC